jgi:mannose-6-phosphate isomerase
MPALFANLAAAAAWYDAWLVEAALPLWASAGRDSARGSFQEALTVTGEPWPAPRRARVQTRQTWVYATAAAEGLGEHYAALAKSAYAFYRPRYRGPDGLFARTADDEGRIVDPTALLYEQAFSLLAMAALERLEPGAGAADAAGWRAGGDAASRPRRPRGRRSAVAGPPRL